MAQADTQKAIGAVTRLLRDHLIRRGFAVSVGKPEAAARAEGSAKLNLFLFETMFDGSLRNFAFEPGNGPGNRPPLWMALRYLVTAFDDDEASDSAEAHELLGQGLMALHELNFRALDAATPSSVRLALEPNPEPLKITFEDSAPDLLNKLMQGSEETYRLSAAMQVRPVMLLPGEPPAFSQLVGIDYTQPGYAETPEPVGIEALPTLGARIDSIEPERFEPGQTITVRGASLDLGGLVPVLGETPLRVTGQWPDRLTAEIESPEPSPGPEGRIAMGLGPSAGQIPLVMREERGGGRFRSSNILPASLLPVLATAAVNGADIVLGGRLLGGDADDVAIVLLRDGKVVRQFEDATTRADQGEVTFAGAAGSLDPGTYQVVLRVNGARALASPSVSLP